MDLRTVMGPVLAAVLLGTPARAEDRAAQIDALFGFATEDTPGCVVGVVLEGEVIAIRAYGLADVERRVPLTPSSLFDVGSNQKQFVAAAVLLLVEDGRLSLADDVREHVPELPDYGHTITLDHLLTHTSGVRDWPGLMTLAEEGTDVLELILRQRALNFAPGEEWSYSSSGYELLKVVLARASGRPLAELLHARLFEPLGMRSTAYVPDILHASGERALAYMKDGAGWKPYMRLGKQRGGGALVSTAGDLLVWSEALARGALGRFVTEKLQEPARLANGRKLGYARGLNVSTLPEGLLISHSGSAAGYGSWLGRLADEELAIVVLSNFEPLSTGNLAGRVADLFLPPPDPDALPPRPVAAPGVDVAGRAGLYFERSTAEPLRLVVERGELSFPGGPALVPVSAERFLPARATLFFRSEDAFELSFSSDDELELKSMEGRVSRYARARPWRPGAAELEAFEGRYDCQDLGRVFEIESAGEGLVWRLEAEPARAVELEPVAPDTFMRMRDMAILRFERDARGEVTGFRYGNRVVRNFTLTRLEDRVEPDR